jgi:hypothetical protein
MLSEKALFNSLMIYTTMEGKYSERNCYDLNIFFRDVQYNPFNSVKIIDFLLFSLWEANYILNENPKNYKPLVVDVKRLILEYPGFSIRTSDSEILGNFVGKYIEGKRSVPLILKANYCELNGFSFGEVKFNNLLDF